MMALVACLSPKHPGPCAKPKADNAAASGGASAKKPAGRGSRGKKAAPAGGGASASSGGPGSGKDLIGEDGGKSIQASIAGDKTKYDSADTTMAALAGKQGFDGKPQTVSAKEMDALVAGGARPIYRGIHPAGTGRSAASMQDQFRDGEAYFGAGVFGSGIYMSGDRGQAARYSDHSPGAISKSVLSPKARIAPLVSISAEHDQFLASIPKSDKKGRALWGDMGRYAAAKGYDGIDMGGFTNVLNRSALITQRTAG